MARAAVEAVRGSSSRSGSTVDEHDHRGDHDGDDERVEVGFGGDEDEEEGMEAAIDGEAASFLQVGDDNPHPSPNPNPDPNPAPSPSPHPHLSPFTPNPDPYP